METGLILEVCFINLKHDISGWLKQIIHYVNLHNHHVGLGTSASALTPVMHKLLGQGAEGY